ncbi:DUF5343 domain-containing protein [Variovorax ginsengisoli]|uniref:DUF5343 domain-containing protein n=1 Tax=Variovorax ginsengisoli TaxID=363844 RepID=A0ABT9SHQ5_9BURK|nr:DUF5343 domain-containing protein [Variovorax ginsengisoli]MDP9902942.1 hypothetical protein [Variovorax ginsengisoli]
MADKHPYMSGSGGVTQLVAQLRKAFPGTVTAETLKKLGIAPQNETYVLNIMKFIGVLDSENKKTAAAGPVFNKHDNAEFQQEFAKLVAGPYHELFDLHGEDAWTLPLDKLISFFRNHDGTSDVVGKRQASTFQSLARIGGKLSDDVAAAAKSAPTGAGAKIVRKLAPTKKAALPAQAQSPAHVPVLVQPPIQANAVAAGAGGVGLTVRIEINLPPGGDQATYDAIFKSIRENLLNGNGA